MCFFNLLFVCVCMSARVSVPKCNLYILWCFHYALCLLCCSFHFIQFFRYFFPFVIFQSHIVQAMSALLCCGPCFDSQYLMEDGLIYPWLDTLLISTDDKVRFDPRILMFLPIQNLKVKIQTFDFVSISIFELQVYDLAREIVVLLLESNPDSGHLLEWVIDRCYTAQPREADICFLSLATVFSARYVQNQ